MNTAHYLNMVAGRKGQFVQIQWTRTVNTAAAFRHHIVTKNTRTTARTGIEYDHIAAVQERRESGELPMQNAGLQWGTWSVYPYVIRHNGVEYARIYSKTGAVPIVQYYIDGIPATRNEVCQLLTPSDAKKERALEGSINECFTVKMADVEIVG